MDCKAWWQAAVAGLSGCVLLRYTTCGHMVLSASSMSRAVSLMTKENCLDRCMTPIAEIGLQ
jgi:hypothetical protein